MGKRDIPAHLILFISQPGAVFLGMSACSNRMPLFVYPLHCANMAKISTGTQYWAVLTVAFPVEFLVIPNRGELELELIQTQMAQKPMLRAEVGMRVRCANKASAE